MKVLKNVHDARAKLKARGVSDAKHADAIADLTERVQTIVAEMNKAKIDAMRKAEEPFLSELEELDREMAVLITIMS